MGNAWVVLFYSFARSVLYSFSVAKKAATIDIAYNISISIPSEYSNGIHICSGIRIVVIAKNIVANSILFMILANIPRSANSGIR